MMFDVINTCATCATPCWASALRHVGLVCYVGLWMIGRGVRVKGKGSKLNVEERRGTVEQ
jgi:hypothetical protein